MPSITSQPQDYCLAKRGAGDKRGGEHRVNKMDITGTFRTSHDRELSGRKAGNLKEVGLGWINGVEKIMVLDGGR